MRAVIRGFLSQSREMFPLERLYRWRRSLGDGASVHKSSRKVIIFLAVSILVLLYYGPSMFLWLFSGGRKLLTASRQLQANSCLRGGFALQHQDELDSLSADLHLQGRFGFDEDDGDDAAQSLENSQAYLPYTGNGHIGLVVLGKGLEDQDDTRLQVNAYLKRNLVQAAVNFRPTVRLTSANSPDQGYAKSTATLVSFLRGVVETLSCHSSQSDQAERGNDGAKDQNSDGISILRKVYAHRQIPEILVQDFDVTNNGAQTQTFKVEQSAQSSAWRDSAPEKISLVLDQKKDEGKKGKEIWVQVTVAEVKVPTASNQGSLSIIPLSLAENKVNNLYMLVAVATQVLDGILSVPAKSSEKLTILTSVVASPIVGDKAALQAIDRTKLKMDATRVLEKTLNMIKDDKEALWKSHVDSWRRLWTTGFGISHSMAENAINGKQINATLYYLLSNSPNTRTDVGSDSSPSEMENYYARLQLNIMEGCYGSLPTLHETKNLWRPLSRLADVNSVVRYWILNLEVNGCHNLLKSGAEGTGQAYVQSLVGLKFRQHHLELDANPKDLHRDFNIRNLRYGNLSRVTLDVLVQPDNKAVIRVKTEASGDRVASSGGLYGCDAGCLDAPVKLSSAEFTQFPVKLTDPVTAVLYITPDYQHVQDLKHTIHVKEVIDAPAHEHHVIALHKHGNKLGGLPPVFWFSIGFLILVFHAFLFKLIWQEYCASGPDKYSKFI